jgi:hypothetical protein
MGYNVMFDVEMLQSEFAAAGVEKLNLKRYAIIDVMKFWSQMLPYLPRKCSEVRMTLTSVYQVLHHRTYKVQHDACADVLTTLLVLEGLMEWFNLKRINVVPLHWSLRLKCG